MKSLVHFYYFPQTEPPPPFVAQVVGVFRQYEAVVSTATRMKGLTSNEVLGVIRPGLLAVGFETEAGKLVADKISRPVFFGEGGVPTLAYEVDAYHAGWRCGLEIEAGRAWMGNAVYRDLVQAMMMVQVDILVLAVPNSYKYMSDGIRGTVPPARFRTPSAALARTAARS